MRFLLLLVLTMGSLAQGEEPAPVPAPAPASAAAAPAEVPPDVASPAAKSAFSTFIDQLSLGIGLSTFGELFPVSSVKVPGTTRGQFSLMGGVRFSLGTQLRDYFRLMAVIEIGYGNSGYFPGRAADGVMEGAGVEVTLEVFSRIKPFIRFMYDALVFPIRENPEGKLSYSAFFVSAGVRVWIVDVHLSIGRDYAGGVSPGLGLGVGWLY